MALTDANATSEQLEAQQKIDAARRRAADIATELEKARISGRSTWTDENGTTWTYDVLEGDKVRIEGCETTERVLRIPQKIEGMDVSAIFADGVAGQTSVEEIYCHDDIYSIGNFAFRGCVNLKKLVLPKNCASFDMTWLKGCGQVEELKLSGQLVKLPMAVFNDCPLKKLTVGPALHDVEPGAFCRSVLEEIVVDPGNAFLSTDGKALYTLDGTTLIALAVPCESYKVQEGCVRIAKKGLSSFGCLKKVELPQGLRRVGNHAYLRTGIEEFIAPSSLKTIGENAFFNCKALKRVVLNEGLREIRDHAFQKTPVERLIIPSTVEFIGRDVATETPLTYDGPDATCKVAEGSPFLRIDDYGALYTFEEDGKHLASLMNPNVEEVEVEPGTVAVNPNACIKHKHLRKIVLPDGLKVIGKAAFRDCNRLTEAVIPDSVEVIDDEAFLDADLNKIYLPASLKTLGVNALVPVGCHRGEGGTDVKEVEIAPNLDKYYTVPGLLIERKKSGKDRVLLHIANTDVIRFPESVNAIAPYALNNAYGIKELYVSEDIMYIDIRGLAVNGHIDKVHVDLKEPYEGHEYFDFFFPDTTYGTQQLSLAFSMKDYVSAKDVFEHYDIGISTRGGYGRSVVGGMSVYEQALRIIERLKDPVHMTRSNKAKFDSTLNVNIENICAELAKHDDRTAIDDLLELGYLTEENLVNVIARVSNIQDATITNYLLEIKRRYFNHGFDEADYDL